MKKNSHPLPHITAKTLRYFKVVAEMSPHPNLSTGRNPCQLFSLKNKFSPRSLKKASDAISKNMKVSFSRISSEMMSMMMKID